MKEILIERLWNLTKRINKIDHLSFMYNDNQLHKKLQAAKLIYITRGEILCLERVLKIMASNAS